MQKGIDLKNVASRSELAAGLCIWRKSSSEFLLKIIFCQVVVIQGGIWDD